MFRKEHERTLVDRGTDWGNKDNQKLKDNKLLLIL